MEFLFDSLKFAAVWLPFFSFAFGIIRLHSMKSPFILILLICLITFGIEFNIVARFFGKESQLLAENIFSYWYVIVLLLFYFISIKAKIGGFQQRFVGILMMLSIVVLTFLSFFLDNVFLYPQWSLQSGNMIVVFFSTVVVVIEGKDMSSPISRKPVFWVALAMLVVTSGVVLDFCIRPYLARSLSKVQIFKMIYLQSLIINVIFYSLTLKGVWEAGRKT